MSDRAPRPLDAELRAAMALRARPGGYSALLGAGVSRSSGVPTAWEVLEKLVHRAAAASGELDVGDPAAWWQARTGAPPTYPEVLAEVAATQDERRAVLAEFFERSEDDAEDGVKVPTAGHRALAQLAKAGLTRIFVTTNFDLLLEEALRDESMEPVVLSTPEAIAGMEPLHAQRCVVIHAHGDYLNPGVLNTEDELGSYPEPVGRRVAQVFDEYGLMIVGWSASWDRALGDLLQAAGPPRYASWWIEPADLNHGDHRPRRPRHRARTRPTALQHRPPPRRHRLRHPRRRARRPRRCHPSRTTGRPGPRRPATPRLAPRATRGAMTPLTPPASTLTITPPNHPPAPPP